MGNLETRKKINRRNFFKMSSLASAAGAALGISGPAEKTDDASIDIDKVLPAKEREKFPVLVTDKCKRMNQRNTVFSRRVWDKSLDTDRDGGPPSEGEDKPAAPGYTQLDEALDQAGWAVDGTIADGSCVGFPQSTAYKWEGEVHPNQYKFKSPEDAAKKIKKAAKYLGASLVGITAYDRLWDYSKLVYMDREKRNRDEEGGGRREQFDMIEPDFPFEPKSVVVMAFEMDYTSIGTSPSCIEGAATGLGYSKMAQTGLSVANFIRQLGYKTFALGNDVALSVPYAIAAGLGELGRNGILITREYGPRIRLAKIFTELEIKPDKPKTFGVWDFCKSCKRCVEACPSGAISAGNPTLEGTNISNNPGALKWYVDAEKCIKFWGENRSDCTNCITACPFNKPPMWHHKLVASSASIPGAPLHYVMAKMDKIFGFGDVNNVQANIDFWDKED